MHITSTRVARLGLVSTIAGLAMVAGAVLNAQAGANTTNKLLLVSDHTAAANYEAQRFGTHKSTLALIAAQQHAQSMPQATTPPGAVARVSASGLAPQTSGLPGGRWTSIGPTALDSNAGNPVYIGQTGPNSGRTLAVVTDPTTSGASQVIYIGAEGGGVWKSANNGVSWTPLTDSMPVLTIGSLAIDPTNPQVLYAGTGENDHCGDCGYGVGVYKTSNGGATWSILGGTNPATNPLISSSGVTYKNNVMAIDPNNHNVLWVGNNHGLYKYDNSTSAWTQITAVTLPALQITDIAIDNTTSPSTLYVGDSASFGGDSTSGIYKSVDNGNTWTDLTPALISSVPSTYTAGGINWKDRNNIGRISLGMAPSNHHVFYVAIAAPNEDLYGTDPSNPVNGGLIFKTINGGTSFTPYLAPDFPNGAHAPGFGQGSYDLYAKVDPANPNIAYFGGVNIVRTTDAGSTWTDLTTVYDAYPSPVHPDQHAFWFNGSPVGGYTPFYIGNDGGVYYSGDGGNSWSNLNSNLNTLETYVTTAGLNFANQPLAWSGMQDNGSNKYIGNMAWQNLFGGDGGFTAIDPTNQKNVYEEYVDLSIYHSTDGGFSWNGATTGIAKFPTIQRNPNPGASNALFIAPFIMDPNAIYSNATPGYTPPAGGPSPAHAWNQHLLAGSNYLYETLDGGATWCPLNATAFTASISAIAIAPSTSQPNLEVFYVGLTNGQVWQTVNGYVTANAATTPGTPNCAATAPFTEIDNGQITAPSDTAPYIANLSVDPVDASLVYAATSFGNNNYAFFNGPHVFSTAGAGHYTWKAIDGSGSTALPNVNANAIVSYQSNVGTVVVVGMDTQVYYTINPGTTTTPAWTQLGTLPNSSLNYLAIDASQTTLLAATKGRGTYVMPIPQLTPASMGSGDTIGIFNPSLTNIAGIFELSNSLTTGAVDINMPMGSTYDAGVVGDWTGIGTDTIGVYRPRTTQFILKDSNAALAPATHVFTYGQSTSVPVTGDWTGSGTDKVGVYSPSKGIFYLRNSLSTGVADETVVFGPLNAQPIAGHWTGGATDTIGVYANGIFYLSNTSCATGTTCVGALYKELAFGSAGDIAVVGDWTHSGSTELGVYRPSNGVFYLCLSPTQTCTMSDIATVWLGDPGSPLAGHWNNTGNPFTPPPATNIVVPKTPTPSNPNGGSVQGGNSIGG